MLVAVIKVYNLPILLDNIDFEQELKYTNDQDTKGKKKQARSRKYFT